LYDLPELKINQKFAIEVLLRDLGQPKNGKNIPRSNELKKRQQLYEEEMSGAMMPDEIDGFNDIAIGSLNKGVQNPRFSPAAIAESLPDLESLLRFPPASGPPANQARLRQIVQNAVQRAIMEIIGPVVERSVTIATIATKDLIHKDYAQEEDEERVRDASQKMAKALSGSLALVTCKEPLRMSMTNYIRLAAQEAPDQTFPEGAILMCVNDNLDMACSVVEKQAEDRSLPEIDAHIDNEIEKRRRFKADFPNEPYRDPITSHWSSYIPEPYKQVPGGLNQEQLDIYLQFARQTRGILNHAQNLSTDSGKQMPDVLQDATFPSMPNLTTPAESAAVPLQPPPMQQQHQNRVMPPAMTNPRTQHQVNGFVDIETIYEHVQDLFAKTTQLAEASSEDHFRDLTRESPIFDIFNRIDHIAGSALYTDSVKPLEVEILARILQRVCQASENTHMRLVLILRHQDDEKFLNSLATAALLELGLLEYPHVDRVLAKLIREHNPNAIQCLSDLLNTLLLVNHPVALRADFSSSLGAMGERLSQDPNLEIAKAVIADLRKGGVVEEADNASTESAELQEKHQLQYAFNEWLALCSGEDRSERESVAFITQLLEQLLNSSEEMVVFLRVCIDSSVDAFERFEMSAMVDPYEGFFEIDSLSKLLILMVKSQGEAEGSINGSKSAYLQTILALIVLILNNHHVMRGEQFNQRVFYRLFSTMLYDWNEFIRGADPQQDKEMIRVFAENFLLLDPHYFPGFVFSWLSLASHRVFMPTILRQSDDEGCEPYSKIMEVMLSYVSDLLKPGSAGGPAKELYRGVLRILLILHHDFPEFLAENHYRLCNVLPQHCMQLRNLVLSAYPSSILELPDPFTAGLKVDRLEEIRKSPNVAGDISAALRVGNLKETVDNALRGPSMTDDQIAEITDAINRFIENSDNVQLNTALPHALVLHIGQTSFAANSAKNGPSFNPDSPHASLMNRLAKELHPEPRYYFLSAIVNQLRYPNSHTHFFSYALLHLFGNDHADQQESDVRQQITRVLLERLYVSRPHPWGLIITMLELLKNPAYAFWELPFIKANPEVCVSIFVTPEVF
jgi:CCR4-NOT transcription complex subunit 1